MTQHPYRRAPRVFWSSTTAPRTAASAGSTASKDLAKPDRRAHPDPRQLAQPGRDLLLSRTTQSRHPQRLRRPRPLEHQLLAFGRRYEQIAAPFQWKFTRQDLNKLLAKTDPKPAITRRLGYVRELPSQTTKTNATPPARRDDPSRRSVDPRGTAWHRPHGRPHLVGQPTRGQRIGMGSVPLSVIHGLAPPAAPPARDPEREPGSRAPTQPHARRRRPIARSSRPDPHPQPRG